MKQAQLNEIKVANAQGEHYLTITQRPLYVYAKWSGHITSDDVIKAANLYLEYVQEHPCNKLLNDKSDVTGDWEDANDWLEFDWLPAVYKAGLRCLAHVYSLSMFSQLSARDLRDRVMPPLLMKNFMDFEAAEKWLLACKPNNYSMPA
ncbi:hypothetical protein [Pontibacter fetidus]|uniref:STAS/SEC14 domain-containing protein n=1 Tax=Pontibacter fetidus TaxID=2700082 RepID=A0A6B2H310_9BACT|nr:hypothetical protein [Pontibacter fetidus]NDK55006.1 hypothetical protein [Pontibacter fetidus]